jgi:energy-coupling factor transport system substrate-specific component
VSTGRDNWRLDRRAVRSVLIGTVVYAVFSWAANTMVIPGLPSLRPGIVIPILCGALFGPIEGFVVGAAGRGVGDLLTFGFFWNWDVGNGLIGSVAGLTALVGPATRRWTWAWVGTATLLGAVGIMAGSGFAALTDIWVANLEADLAVSAEWFPVAKWDLALGVPLTLGVLLAWEGLRRRSQREQTPTRREGASAAPYVD